MAFQHIPSHVSISNVYRPTASSKVFNRTWDEIRHHHLYRKRPPALVPIFEKPEINRAYFNTKSLALILRREKTDESTIVTLIIDSAN